jgi:hypothetical protein
VELGGNSQLVHYSMHCNEFIFPQACVADPDPLLSVFGSGSYSNEDNKKNSKGKFINVRLLFGSWWTT